MALAGADAESYLSVPDTKTAGSSRRTSTSTAPSWRVLALRNLRVPDASLFRGTPVGKVLGNFASVLSDRAPTAEYFELSEPVESINIFISHNWSAPRWKKFWVLVFHFNLLRALMIALLVGAGSCVLTYQGFLPLATASTSLVDNGKEFSRGFLALPLGVTAFLASLLTLHKVDRLPFAPFKRRMLWLDKTCVHQTDKDRKREGIQSLAAFLARSEDIVVLYTDVYMTRLWTVYEVASWLMLHRGKRIFLRPLQVPPALLAGVLCFTALEVVACLVQLSFFDSIPPMLTSALPIVIIYVFTAGAAWLGSKLAEERNRVIEHVRRFRLSDAKCANEDDREIVQQNILAFMRMAELCDADAEDEAAFSAFEDLVREDVPKLILSSFGRVGVPYSWEVATFIMPRALVYFDYCAGQLHDSRPLRYILLNLAYNASFLLFVCPLIAAMTFAWGGMPRLRSAPALAVLGALMTLALSASIMMFYRLLALAEESDLWLAVLLTIFTILGLSTLMVYRPLPAPGT